MISSNIVTANSYLTLHYRLGTISGSDIVSTFNTSPATLQLGTGQLAEFLEARLLGLPENTHTTFELGPEAAFGSRNPDLIRWVSRSMVEENSHSETEYNVGDLVGFAAPGGGQFSGVLREIGLERFLFDFNHPLAGETLIFEVKIIGIL